MTRAAPRRESSSKVNRYRARDTHADLVPHSRCYSASWDDAAQLVRFSMACGALRVAITRDALEMLAQCHLPTSSGALREFRRHRTLIETLATVTMFERCELAVVLTKADIRFQLAREGETLVRTVRVTRREDHAN